MLIFTCLKVRDTQRDLKERKRMFHLLLHSLVPIIARVGPGQNQKFKTPSGPTSWVIEAQALESSPFFRKLGGKQSTQGSNLYSDMGCECPTQQLHNTWPMLYLTKISQNKESNLHPILSKNNPGSALNFI